MDEQFRKSFASLSSQNNWILNTTFSFFFFESALKTNKNGKLSKASPIQTVQRTWLKIQDFMKRQRGSTWWLKSSSSLLLSIHQYKRNHSQTTLTNWLIYMQFCTPIYHVMFFKSILSSKHWCVLFLYIKRRYMYLGTCHVRNMLNHSCKYTWKEKDTQSQ